MVDIASTFMFDEPLPLTGDLEIRRKLYGVSDPERCRAGVYGTSGQTTVSGSEKIDRLRARQSN